MLKFVLRKMLNKKWMVLALLIGNVLLISIAASNPMYTDAVLKRTLDTALSDYVESSNKYPLLIRIENANYSTDYAGIRNFEQELENESAARFGLPVKKIIQFYSTSLRETTSDLERQERRSDLSIGYLTDLNDHITLVEGKLPSKEPDENGVIDVIVSEYAYQSRNMLLNEVVTFTKVTTPEGEPISFRIAGIFKESDMTDPYWVRDAKFYTVAFMDEDLFRSWFIDKVNDTTSVLTYWYAMYDYSDIQVEDVDRIQAAGEFYHNYFGGTNAVKIYDNFANLLTSFKQNEAKVRTTFMVLQVPVLILLAAFIFMVTNQLLDMEQSEISVIKSRGASRGQIIGIYLVQSLVTVGISFAVSIPLAIFVVKMLGASAGFLEFVSRKSMQVRFIRDSWLYALGASLFSVLAMVLPVLKHSRVTIVNQKQKRNSRRSDQPLWQKFFLDVILLGASIYGLFNFNNQKEMLAQAVLEGKALDPMLFISSSLFMLGAGMFLLRVLPFVIRFIFWLFKDKWSPALYTSFIRVLRTRKQQGFIMIFLVVTLALGVFDASAARTISRNDERSLKYMTGADIVLAEKWKDNSSQLEDNPELTLEYEEPDFGRYSTLEGAALATKVFVNNNGTVQLSNAAAATLTSVQIRGINTKEFGQVAWFDSTLLTPHWYNYLNAMAQRSDAVLVSSNFKDYGYKINDVIYYQTDKTKTMKGVIYGFVDYWPGYAKTSYRRTTDGTYQEKANFLVVGNLAEQQKNWGIFPYQIWIKNKEGSRYIYDFIQEEQPELTAFTDLSEELVNHKNDAIRQGTYGILTVGWIVSMVVCSVCFLIYWILSIRSRELQFGIFRAMGMSMREIITMLLNEQFWISFVSILVGAGVGYLTSRLFMPLIQIAYSSSENALPLEVVFYASDNIRLGIVVGVIIAVCISILVWIIRRMKIAQALKLGED